MKGFLNSCRRILICSPWSLITSCAQQAFSCSLLNQKSSREVRLRPVLYFGLRSSKHTLPEAFCLEPSNSQSSQVCFRNLLLLDYLAVSTMTMPTSKKSANKFKEGFWFPGWGHHIILPGTTTTFSCQKISKDILPHIATHVKYPSTDEHCLSSDEVPTSWLYKTIQSIWIFTHCARNIGNWALRTLPATMFTSATTLPRTCLVLPHFYILHLHPHHCH